MPEHFDDHSTANHGERERPQVAPRLVPSLTLISHPLARRAGERLLLEALEAGGEVALSRIAPAFARPGAGPGVPLGDPFISRKPLVFSSGSGGRLHLRVEEGGSSIRVDGVSLRGTRELSPRDLDVGVVLELAERVVLLLHRVEMDPEAAPVVALDLMGGSTAIRHVRGHIQRLADLDVPVLIRGETGTGKELVAQAIHRHGTRRDKPFVSVNLGALPRELAAAELFGARRGAFTGATQERPGFFRAAQGGTLFLDEVGEAPPEVQVLLLRVLETGELYPVGGHTPVAVDVRLIAATDADLETSIREGRFRAPLLHRLAGYELGLPPLRERREDIGLLFFHFARQELEALGEVHRLEPADPRAEPWLPSSLAVHLVRHAWPGNIRQLRNVARQLAIGSRGRATLMVEPKLARDLDAAVPPASLPQATPSIPGEGQARGRRKASELSEQELLEALRACSWDLKAAALRLGISRGSLYDLIGKSGHLRTAGELSAEEVSRCFQECQGDLDAMARRLEVSRRGLLRRVRGLGLLG